MNQPSALREATKSLATVHRAILAVVTERPWQERKLNDAGLTVLKVMADLDRLAALSAPQGDSKPVAWKWEAARMYFSDPQAVWETQYANYKPPEKNPRVRNVTPLYAHPPSDSEARALLVEIYEAASALSLMIPQEVVGRYRDKDDKFVDFNIHDWKKRARAAVSRITKHEEG